MASLCHPYLYIIVSINYESARTEICVHYGWSQEMDFTIQNRMLGENSVEYEAYLEGWLFREEGEVKRMDFSSFINTVER